jgi:hypothetical protein
MVLTATLTSGKVKTSGPRCSNTPAHAATATTNGANAMTTREIIQPSDNRHIQPVGFVEDEADNLLAFLNALTMMLPARFTHNMEAKDFEAIMVQVIRQAERVRAAVDQRAGHA